MSIKKFLKKHKKLIFQTAFRTTVVFLFLSAATLLVLWASGYKYNRYTKKFEKTGLIYLLSEPKNVKIYINGKLVKEKTPARLDYILPGRYKVEIKKIGYYDWTKDIEVTAGKVKKYDNIILFLKDRDTTEISQNINQFYLSPNKEKILINEEKQYIYDLQNNQKNVLKTDQNLTFLFWSNNSEKILFSSSDKYFIYDLGQEKFFPIIVDDKQSITKTYLYPKNSQQMYYLKNNDLFLTDLEGHSSLLTQNIFNFQIDDNNLIYITKEQDKFLLKESNFDLKNSDTIIELKSPEYEIYNQNSYLALKDTKGNLYTIKNNNLEKLNVSVEFASWSETSGFLGLRKKTKLVYKTKIDEIWVYDPENKTNDLVSRLEKNIEKCLWYFKLNHIIFNNDQEIIITELDGKNQTIIANGTNPDLLSEKELLYIDPNKVLKKLEIR